MMTSWPFPQCRDRCFRGRWLVAAYLVWWLGVSNALPAAWSQPESAPAIYPGDTVIVTQEGVELGVRDQAAIVLKVGDRIRVTEVRGVWIGGHATVDGQKYTGWVHRREIKLTGTEPRQVAPIESPSQPDDPQAVRALEALNVRFITTPQGHVILADATESELDDAGMAHFRGLPHLAFLDVSSRPITDEGFAHLTDLQVLQELYAVDTQITDAGLAHMAKLQNLEILALANTAITGAGLNELQKLSGLQALNLAACQVGDDELRPLSAMPQLEVLVLSRTRVTSAGLIHLTSITRLRVLNLIGCAVGDSGLTHLEPLNSLRMLYVELTEVTEDGAALLTEMRPTLAVFY
jgi:hypothetical protein